MCFGVVSEKGGDEAVRAQTRPPHQLRRKTEHVGERPHPEAIATVVDAFLEFLEMTEEVVLSLAVWMGFVEEE